jgi:hypothetical protein
VLVFTGASKDDDKEYSATFFWAAVLLSSITICLFELPLLNHQYKTAVEATISK